MGSREVGWGVERQREGLTKMKCTQRSYLGIHDLAI